MTPPLMILAEFIGGPADGKTAIVPGDRHEITIASERPFELTAAGQIFDEDTYRVRITNGIAARLPNGATPFDWQPPKKPGGETTAGPS